MMKKDHVILGVHVTDRMKKAGEVQRLFSEYGQCIKTRLGLHQMTEENAAGAAGLILLEMVGDAAKASELLSRLNAIEGVEAKKMVFEHAK